MTLTNVSIFVSGINLSHLKGREEMKKNATKTALASGVFFLALVLFASEVFSWGFATHAYVDNQIGMERGPNNRSELYGGMVVDLFNYSFDYPLYLDLLYDQTHEGFMKVWNVAKGKPEKSTALGFVSHNDLWGADSTAHRLCLTCIQPEGYAIVKARDLLTIAPLPTELGIPEDVAIEIFHEIVETGVDLLIKRQEASIGQKIVSSALYRSPRFPSLLVSAYAQDLSEFAGISFSEAEKFITTVEKEFRKSIMLYGQSLQQDEEPAIGLIAGQTADVAESFLGLYDIQIPLTKEEIVALVVDYMNLAISICEPDYLGEINATANFVEEQLRGHGVAY